MTHLLKVFSKSLVSVGYFVVVDFGCKFFRCLVLFWLFVVIVRASFGCCCDRADLRAIFVFCQINFFKQKSETFLSHN